MLYETFKLLPLNLCLLHSLKLCLKNSDIPIAVQNFRVFPCCSELHIRVLSCIKQRMYADILSATSVQHTRDLPNINPRVYAHIPSVTCVYQLFCRTNKLQQQDEASTTPSFCLRYSKVSLGSGFVRISATCSLEGTYSNLTFCSSTCSRRKWYLIGMCLVFECMTGFFEMLIALVLSHKIETGGVQVI